MLNKMIQSTHLCGFIVLPGLVMSTVAFCEAGISTTVEKPLQIAPFCSNKANFRKAQMNVNKVLTKDYENKSDWTLGENEPNQSQFKKSQNELNLIFNKGL